MRIKAFLFIIITFWFALTYVFATWENNLNSGYIHQTIEQSIDIKINQISSNQENKFREYKDDLTKMFDEYVWLTKEIKSDFWKYFWVIIWIIAILWGVLRFYIQKITNSLVKNWVQDNIQPILDNKITEYDQKIEEEFQRVWAEVKEKSVLIVWLDTNRRSFEVIRNQGFRNITESNTINVWLELDSIIIDLLNVDMTTDENKFNFRWFLESINTNYSNVPLLIFYNGQLSRSDFQLPELTTFANNQLSLVSNLYDCLRYQKDIWNVAVWE